MKELRSESKPLNRKNKMYSQPMYDKILGEIVTNDPWDVSILPMFYSQDRANLLVQKNVGICFYSGIKIKNLYQRKTSFCCINYFEIEN